MGQNGRHELRRPLLPDGDREGLDLLGALVGLQEVEHPVVRGRADGAVPPDLDPVGRERLQAFFRPDEELVAVGGDVLAELGSADALLGTLLELAGVVGRGHGEQEGQLAGLDRFALGHGHRHPVSRGVRVLPHRLRLDGRDRLLLGEGVAVAVVGERRGCGVHNRPYLEQHQQDQAGQQVLQRDHPARGVDHQDRHRDERHDDDDQPGPRLDGLLRGIPQDQHRQQDQTPLRGVHPRGRAGHLPGGRTLGRAEGPGRIGDDLGHRYLLERIRRGRYAGAGGGPLPGHPPAVAGSAQGQSAASTSDCAVPRRSAGSLPLTMSAVALPSGPQTAFICGMFGIGVPPSAATPQASMSGLSCETWS